MDRAISELVGIEVVVWVADPDDEVLIEGEVRNDQNLWMAFGGGGRGGAHLSEDDLRVTKL